jgi:NDP-sugar pyrophosphorylase family protein
MSAPLQQVSAAILAGGLGTRLRSVVADRPKVLAPVGGKPYLSYLLDQLARAGVRETVLLVGYAADQVRVTFGDKFAGMRLAYSQEREPLGTAGAVRLALPLFREETLLLLNGDSYCDVDLAAFVDSHRQRRAMASLTLATVENVSRYGRVRLEPDGRVVGFEEKGDASGPGHVNAGVYLIQRDALCDIPESRPVSLERDVLPRWVEAGGVYGFAGGRFIDIGTPASYTEAEAFFRA